MKRISKLIRGLIMIYMFASVMFLMGCGEEKEKISIIDDENLCLQINNVVFNSQGEILFDEEEINNIKFSLDRSAFALEDVQGKFYVSDGKKTVLVSEDVKEYVVANYGDAVAYWDGYTLYLYNIATEETTTIAENVRKEFCISPDGKSVAYRDEKYGDLYLSKNGKPGKMLYEEQIPVAISNDGKNVCYYDAGNCYCLNGERITGYMYSITLNADHTEMICSGMGPVYYINDKGKIIEQENATNIQFYSVGGELSRVYLDEYEASAVSLTSFDGLITELNDNVGRLSKKGRKVEITEEYGVSDSRIYVSETGTSAVYVSAMNCEEICYIKNSKKSMKAKTLRKGDAKSTSESDAYITEIIVSEDLKDVYYVESGDLYYLNGKKPVRLARNLEKITSEEMISYSDKYERIYFVLEGALHCAKTKENSVEKITEGLNIVEIIRMGENIFFFTQGEHYDDVEVYMVTGETETEMIFTSKLDLGYLN